MARSGGVAPFSYIFDFKFYFYNHLLYFALFLYSFFYCAKCKPHLTLDSGHKERKVDKEDDQMIRFFRKGYYLFCLTLNFLWL